MCTCTNICAPTHGREWASDRMSLPGIASQLNASFELRTPLSRNSEAISSTIARSATLHGVSGSHVVFQRQSSRGCTFVVLSNASCVHDQLLWIFVSWVVRTTFDCFANKAIASTTKPLLTWVVRCLGPPACPPIESECLLVVVRDQTLCNKDRVSPHSKTCSRTSANTSPSRYIGKHCKYLS